MRISASRSSTSVFLSTTSTGWRACSNFKDRERMENMEWWICSRCSSRRNSRGSNGTIM